MFKHIMLTLTFAAAFGAAGLCLTDKAEARWGWNRPYVSYYYGPRAVLRVRRTLPDVLPRILCTPAVLQRVLRRSRLLLLPACTARGCSGRTNVAITSAYRARPHHIRRLAEQTSPGLREITMIVRKIVAVAFFAVLSRRYSQRRAPHRRRTACTTPQRRTIPDMAHRITPDTGLRIIGYGIIRPARITPGMDHPITLDTVLRTTRDMDRRTTRDTDGPSETHSCSISGSTHFGSSFGRTRASPTATANATINAGSPAMIGQSTSAKASKRWLPVPAASATSNQRRLHLMKEGAVRPALSCCALRARQRVPTCLRDR